MNECIAWVNASASSAADSTALFLDGVNWSFVLWGFFGSMLFHSLGVLYRAYKAKHAFVDTEVTEHE